MNCRLLRFRSSPVQIPNSLVLRLELLDEYARCRGTGLARASYWSLRGLRNCCERGASIAGRIHFALRGTGDDVPTNPVVDPVSCGEEIDKTPFDPSARATTCSQRWRPFSASVRFSRRDQPRSVG
jgi:hypothetical protein